MKFEKWLNLQLFAGEGAGDGGGEGAAAGDTAVDAGQQRLLELGVPADKIRKRAQKTAPKLPQGAVKTSQAQQPTEKTAPKQEGKPSDQQAAAAETDTEDGKTDAPGRMSWDEIMADPEYNRQMQSVVQSRLKAAKGAQEALGLLTPALELLAEKYGLDPAKPDYEALAKAIGADDSYYADKALKMGVSVDTARQVDQQQKENARQARALEEQKIQDHLDSLERQGNEMKSKGFPDFDLRTEMQNPVFARLVSPSVGLSVEDAYHALHRKEIQAAAMEAVAKKTAQQISASIASGAGRPSENGTTGQAPSVTTFDYSKATPDQRAALKAYIRSEAAQGRKVYPGGYPGR